VEQAPYEVVARLFGIADDYWFLIVARYYQIDLLEVPLTKFLDLILAWCREVVHDENEWERFLYELAEPLPGRREVSERAVEMEGEGFLVAMNTLRRS